MLSAVFDKVLLTGGNGFLGSHVAARLKSSGYASVLTPGSSQYDLRDQAACAKMMMENKPDAVIHMAGVVGGIGANRRHPGKFLYENALMGLHVIHEAMKAGVKKVVILGTICAYPKFTPPPFREDELWSGYPEETNAPYGIAKKMLLVQAQGYREEYGLNAVYLLPVNLYGPGDNYHPESSHVIPALIRKFEEARVRGDKTVTLWGDGSPTREFLYVEDAAEGIALALEKYNAPEPVNLGNGREIRIKELAEIVAKETGFTGEVIWDITKPNGQPRRSLDVSRAKKAFGFEAKTGFQDGLRKTIADFRASQGHLREVDVDSL